MTAGTKRSAGVILPMLSNAEATPAGFPGPRSMTATPTAIQPLRLPMYNAKLTGYDKTRTSQMASVEVAE